MAGLQQEREQRLAVLLEELARRLGTGDVRDLAADGVPEDRIAVIDRNVARIGLSQLALRYVAPAESQQDTDGTTWVADVSVTWRIRRYDAGPGTLEIPLVVADDGRTARFAGVADHPDDRVPLWLLEPLAVRKGPRSLVLTAQPDQADRLAALAASAVPAVRRVIPGWTGRLVVELPSTEAVLNRVVGSDAASTTLLAGVTATVDGSLSADSPQHVFLNPPVFERLGPRAAQVVVTHEATHVATGAAISGMPLWLLEGFADYVALRDLDLPLAVSARQILAEVRRHGPPGALPNATDYSGANQDIGASYEAAWLACRLIAERYGEAKLVELYRRADRDDSTAAGFTAVLGTDEATFTRDWQGYLTALASTS